MTRCLRISAALPRSQPRQSMLQLTVFSRSMPRYGNRGAGQSEPSCGVAGGEPLYKVSLPSWKNLGIFDFAIRFNPLQRVQAEIGIFPFARDLRNSWATGPKKTSSNVFL